MKDEKDLLVDGEAEGNTENLPEEAVKDLTAVSEDTLSAALDKSASYGDAALNDELEKLAQTFKAELEKAKSMTEEELIKKGVLTPEYEDELGAIPEDELCLCCNEKRRAKEFGENYEYCTDCREAMKRYPFSFQSLLAFAVVIVLAVLSVYSFSLDFIPYNTVREANKYLRENKLDSAMSAFDGAISAFEDKEIVAKKLYLTTSKILFNTMPSGVNSMADIVNRLDTALTDFESRMPVYGEYINLRKDTLVLSATMQKFYEIVENEEYTDFENMSNETYTAAMTEIGSLIDTEVSVVSKDGKTTENVPANEGMVRFCQYMYAYSAGKYADSYQYMREVYETEPSFLWLYAYELGVVDLQKGIFDEAELFADAILDVNVEAGDGYALHSSISRMKGDFNEAVEWADEGLSYDSTYSELIRLKAMAYAADGNFEKAKESVDEAIELGSYGMLHMTAIVIENELGNKDTVQAYLDELEENGVDVTERLQEYLDGEVTVQQLFTEGTGDVE